MVGDFDCDDDDDDLVATMGLTITGGRPNCAVICARVDVEAIVVGMVVVVVDSVTVSPPRDDDGQDGF